MKIFCKVKEHEKEEIIAYCIDSCCKTINKFVCIQCLCENHSQHKIRRINNILELLNEYIHNNKILEKNETTKNQLKNIKDNIKIESDLLKEYINKCIDESFENIFNNAKDRINNLYDDNISNYIDWDNFFNNNNLTNLNNYEKISNYINKNVIDSNNFDNIINKDSPYLTKEKNNNNNTWDIFIKNFKKYCEILKDNLSENIKTYQIYNDNDKDIRSAKTYKIDYSDSDDSFDSFNDKSYDNIQSKLSKCMSIKYFLEENFYFQWLEKTYNNNNFMYAFQKRKLNLIKINDDNIMSLCRSANKFNSDEQIRIEFYCDLNKGGLMEIGIGKDNTGYENTLCSNDNICITTEGIYKGKNLINFSRILDKDIIIFYLFIRVSDKDSSIQQNNYLIKILKNDKIIIELNIDKDDYYIFAGFQKIGNSVQVKDFKNITSNILFQTTSFSEKLISPYFVNYNK
jgi:hypothetical protein